MLVTAVGPYSQQGIIFTLMSKQAEEDSGLCLCVCVCSPVW